MSRSYARHLIHSYLPIRWNPYVRKLIRNLIRIARSAP